MIEIVLYSSATIIVTGVLYTFLKEKKNNKNKMPFKIKDI